MKTKKEKLQTVIMKRSISHYKILKKGPHTGLYDTNDNWISWITPKESRELKDLGVR